MAANQAHTITVEEVELLSFLRQNVIRKICEEAEKQGLDKTDPWVIWAVVDGHVAGHLGPTVGLKTLSIHVCICPHFGM